VTVDSKDNITRRVKYLLKGLMEVIWIVIEDKKITYM
jgi:hypothetical protein